MTSRKAKFKNIRPQTCEKCRHINIASAIECVKCTHVLRKPSKYKNVLCIVDGMRFDSKGEAARWQDLKLLQAAGKICELERQVVFELAPSVQYEGQKPTPPLRYKADFCYFEEGKRMGGPNPRYVVEDYKGKSYGGKGRMSREYKIKRHLMLAVHKIEVLET